MLARGLAFVLIMAFILMLAYILGNRVNGKKASKTMRVALAILGIITFYYCTILFIRMNPAMIAYREKYGCTHVLLGTFGLFSVSMIAGGILSNGGEKQKSRKGKIGLGLLYFAFYFRFVIIAAAPLIIALAIS